MRIEYFVNEVMASQRRHDSRRGASTGRRSPSGVPAVRGSRGERRATSGHLSSRRGLDRITACAGLQHARHHRGPARAGLRPWSSTGDP